MKRCDRVETWRPTVNGAMAFVRLQLWGVVGGAALLSACSFAPPWPPMPMPQTLTRAEIEQFRSREQDRLQNALRECYQRFAVNDCRRDAMERHNEVQHVLRAEELRLNALDREVRQRKLQEPDASMPPEPVSPPLVNRP